MPGMAPYRRHKADDMLGTVVTARYARLIPEWDRATDVVGTVWSEADPRMISGGGRAYWIADGSRYYIAHEADMTAREAVEHTA